MQINVTQFSGGQNEYQNPTSRGVADYLYWMCGKFNLQGQYIITGTGGGSVVPISPGSTPNPIDFVVNSTSFMVDGQSTVTIPQYVGYNLLFVRSGVPQTTITSQSTYFSWNKITGIFTCSPAAVNGEIFQFYPYI